MGHVSRPLALDDLTAQARSLAAVGDLAAARHLLDSALAGTDADPARADPDLADAAALHAQILVTLGDAESARDWAGFAHTAQQRLHGPADDRTVSATATLAAVLHRVGAHRAAAELYTTVVDLLSERDGPHSARVLAAEADRATAEHAGGDCGPAVDRLADAWNRHRSAYGNATPAGIKMLARLATMERDCGDDARAREHLSLADELCRTHLPKDHPLARQVAALSGTAPDPGHSLHHQRAERPTEPPRRGAAASVTAAPAVAAPAVAAPAVAQPAVAQPAVARPASGPPSPVAGSPAAATGGGTGGGTEPDAAEAAEVGGEAPGVTAVPAPGATPAPRHSPDDAGRSTGTLWIPQPQPTAPATSSATTSPGSPSGVTGAPPPAQRRPPDPPAVGPAPVPEPVSAPDPGSFLDRRLPVPVDHTGDQLSRQRMIVTVGAVLVAVLAVVAVVIVWLTMTPGGTAAPAQIPAPNAVSAGPASAGQTSATSASPPSAAGPANVTLRDGRDSVTLTWTYPAGAEGPVVVSGGRAGQPTQAFQQLPAGSADYIVYGLNDRTDYCFTIAVVYGADAVQTSPQVCTHRI